MPDDDKRQRILAAATAVFAERDFHRVQVSDVATRAGVGKGTVYLYFPTKDDLHRVALQASLEQLAVDVETAAGASGQVAATLEAIVLCILRFFWKRQHLLTLIQRHEQRGQRRTGQTAASGAGGGRARCWRAIGWRARTDRGIWRRRFCWGSRARRSSSTRGPTGRRTRHAGSFNSTCTG